MVEVRNGNIDRAIRMFKREVSRDGVLRAFRDKAKGYLKRSAARAAKRRRAAERTARLKRRFKK